MLIKPIKMNKIASTFFLIFSGASFFAQTPITLTSANMPSSGDTIRYSNAFPNSVDYVPTGTNFFWNYDTLIARSQDRYDYKAAFNTPYAFYFIGATKYGIKTADTIGAGTFTFTDVYNFFNKTTANFRTEGTGFKYQGLPLAAYYSDDDELYTFPLNYLDRDSTTFKFNLNLAGTISYGQQGYRINEVDGWGSIKTPHDSAACLRVVSTSYSVDTINISGFGFTFPNVQRAYKWVSLTEKIPMLELSGSYTAGNFLPTQARFRDTYHNLVGTTENNVKSGLQIYPNPSSDLVQLKFAETHTGTLKLYNAATQLVLSSNFDGKSHEISVKALENGTYFCIVVDKSGALISFNKIIVAK